MSKKELIEKIEKALEMVISVSGRKFTIVRDEEDWLTISEKKHQETEKHYSEPEGVWIEVVELLEDSQK